MGAVRGHNATEGCRASQQRRPGCMLQQMRRLLRCGTAHVRVATKSLHVGKAVRAQALNGGEARTRRLAGERGASTLALKESTAFRTIIYYYRPLLPCQAFVAMTVHQLSFCMGRLSRARALATT